MKINNGQRFSKTRSRTHVYKTKHKTHKTKKVKTRITHNCRVVECVSLSLPLCGFCRSVGPPSACVVLQIPNFWSNHGAASTPVIGRRRSIDVINRLPLFFFFFHLDLGKSGRHPGRSDARGYVDFCWNRYHRRGGEAEGSDL